MSDKPETIALGGAGTGRSMGTAPTLSDISKRSRDDLAHERHRKAVERLRAAESELDSTFADLLTAQQEMLAVGVEVTVKMRPSIGAAWDTFRAQQRDKESPVASRRAAPTQSGR